jgi:parallel beta-helix repeat protein
MNKKSSLLIIALTFIFAISLVSSATLYVGTTNASDVDNTCIDINFPCSSIEYSVNLSNSGDNIEILEGNYEINSISISKSLTIHSNSSVLTTNKTAFLIKNAQGVVIDGLLIKGKNIKNAKGGLIVAGIDISNSSEITIRNSNISSFLMGISLQEVKNSKIENNNIYNNIRMGIRIAGIDSESEGYNQINNNYLYNNSEVGIILNSANNFISNNILVNEFLNGTGIKSTNGWINPDFNEFTNNQISGYYYGLYLENVINYSLSSENYYNNFYAIYSKGINQSSLILKKDIICTNNPIYLSNQNIIPAGGKIIRSDCPIKLGNNSFSEPNGTTYGYHEFTINTTENNKIGSKEKGVELIINSLGEYIGNFSVEFVIPDSKPSSGLSTLTGLEIRPTPQINISSYILKIYYSDADISSLDENSLVISYYNSSSDWEIYSSANNNGGVNKDENYVWANITHFSEFGVYGSAPVSPPSSSSGGGSGGGGSGGSSLECQTNWTCSEWSSCVNETQIRSCIKTIPTCTKTTIRPIESQNCTLPTEYVKYNQTGTSKITGAVIGTAEKIAIAGVIIVLIILGIVYAFVKWKRAR